MKKRKFLFTVDILIEEETNGRALEALLHMLNAGRPDDYRVKEGVELGSRIETSLQDSVSRQPVPLTGTPSMASSKHKADEAGTPAQDSSQEVWEDMRGFQRNNTLVRLSINKGPGIKLSLPCRILHTDPAGGSLTVYHVDEKKVYLLKIDEIDDYLVR